MLHISYKLGNKEKTLIRSDKTSLYCVGLDKNWTSRMCFCIKSAHFQEKQKSYRQSMGIIESYKCGERPTLSVSRSSKESCCCPSCTWKVMGVVKKCCRMKKESLRVKFKCWLHSCLHTPGESLHRESAYVRLSVSESFKKCPDSKIRMVWGTVHLQCHHTHGYLVGRWPVRFEMSKNKAAQGPATTVLSWKMTGAPNMHFLISWATKRALREESCGNESLCRDDLVSSFQSFCL